MKRFFLISMLILMSVSLLMAQGDKALGVKIGYYAPSMKDLNDGLDDLEAELGADIDRYGGNIIFGADFTMLYSDLIDFRGEVFYWSQSVDGSVDILDVKTSVTIIPVMISGIYWLQGSGQIEPYIGAGLGLAFISWEVDLDIAKDDDTATPVLFHVLAGAEYPMSPTMSLFAEAGYMIGSFDLKLDIEDIDFDESVSIGGFCLKAGAKFYLD